LREFSLPSGEDHRLRYVHPWSAEDADAFVTHRKSPGYIADAAARKHVRFIGGGVLRTLLRGKQLVEEYGATLPALSRVEHQIRVDMGRQVEHFLRDVMKNEEAQKAVAAAFVPLLRGQVAWNDVKALYDDGLVARVGDDIVVRPVSAVAASVLHQALAAFVRAKKVPLSSLLGSERGLEFERQVHALLDPCKLTVHAKLLSNVSATAVSLNVDYMLPFSKPLDTENNADGRAVLYIPTSPNYPCDAIIVPPSTSASEPIIVVECSVTDPRESKRIAKVREWFVPGGWFSTLKAVHPTRDITVLLCWDEHMTKSRAKTYKALDADAKAASVGAHKVTVCVMDLEGVQQLGVPV
jgi:hypothetical protein